ncbi:hypothetical protein AKJ16_DCAP17537, partial [Drosera capensis]
KVTLCFLRVLGRSVAFSAKIAGNWTEAAAGNQGCPLVVAAELPESGCWQELPRKGVSQCLHKSDGDDFLFRKESYDHLVFSQLVSLPLELTEANWHSVHDHRLTPAQRYHVFVGTLELRTSPTQGGVLAGQIQVSPPLLGL